jgi:hypothetical protein
MPGRALTELAEIRRHRITIVGHQLELTDRPAELQRANLDAFGVDTADWDEAAIV